MPEERSELSETALRVVPEIVAFLRAEAERRKGKTVQDGLSAAASILEDMCPAVDYSDYVRGLHGGAADEPPLSPEELARVRELLAAHPTPSPLTSRPLLDPDALDEQRAPENPQWPVPMLSHFGSMTAARSRASAVTRKLNAAGITTYQPSKAVREGIRCQGSNVTGTVGVSIDVVMPGHRRRLGLAVAEALADAGYYFEVRHDEILTSFTVSFPDEKALPDREPYRLDNCPMCGRSLALRPDGKWFRLPKHDTTKDGAESCRAGGHTPEHAEWLKHLDLSMLEEKKNG